MHFFLPHNTRVVTRSSMLASHQLHRPNAGWRGPTVQPCPLPSLHPAADMAVSGAGHAPPEVLASTIGALGRLGFADEMVLDSLARHLMPGVQQLKAEQIEQLVGGVRGLDMHDNDDL